MVNEESPLIGLANYEAVQVVTDAAKKVANSEAASVATETAKRLLSKAKKYGEIASSGRTSLRMLAFVGGLAIIVDGILCLVWDAITFKFINALIDFYTIVIGIAAVVMESEPGALPWSTNLRSNFGT